MTFFNKFYPLILLVIGVLPITAQTTTIQGKITGAKTDVTVMLRGEDLLLIVPLDEEGNYHFDNIPIGVKINLIPSKGGDVVINTLNGISTFDLVLGLKHINAERPFETASQYLALDLNNSKTVSVLDLVILRRLILGMDNILNFRPSWLFVEEKEYNTITFSNGDYNGNISAPFEITLEGATTVNFIAIKVGDVNGNALE